MSLSFNWNSQHIPNRSALYDCILYCTALCMCEIRFKDLIPVPWQVCVWVLVDVRIAAPVICWVLWPRSPVSETGSLQPGTTTRESRTRGARGLLHHPYHHNPSALSRPSHNTFF